MDSCWVGSTGPQQTEKRPPPAVAHHESKQGRPTTYRTPDVLVATLQGELKDLTQKVELLEKFQDNCLAILESKGLNPGKRQQHTTALESQCRCPSWDYVGSKGSLPCE